VGLSYECFDKKLSGILCEHIGEMIKDKQMDTLLDKNAADDVKELFKVLLHIKKFADKGMEIDENFDYELMNFYEWFCPDANHTFKCPIFNAKAR
jgi:hypothetical protein